MKKLRALFISFRVWRLNRWADTLLHEARHHEKEVRHHNDAAFHYSMQARRVRALAGRVQAARM